ncbi:hypothetical protein COO60DRAFT_1633430 [Scenedesmus sp. NREL 46B-D3]|nr:hypothetical protein COO60DRAFT_1633430 [Scenedesmus sp. NREL 46B-D3]
MFDEQEPDAAVAAGAAAVLAEPAQLTAAAAAAAASPPLPQLHISSDEPAVLAPDGCAALTECQASSLSGSLSSATSSGPVVLAAAAAAAEASQQQLPASAAEAAATGAAAAADGVELKGVDSRQAAGGAARAVRQACAAAAAGPAEVGRGPLAAARTHHSAHPHGVLLSPATRLSLGAAGGDGYASSGRPSLSSESEAASDAAAGGAGMWSLVGPAAAAAARACRQCSHGCSRRCGCLRLEGRLCPEAGAAAVMRLTAAASAQSLTASAVQVQQHPRKDSSSRAAAWDSSSKQQLVSKVLATGLTDFDDDSDSGDEHEHQQQVQQGMYGMRRDDACQQAASGGTLAQPATGHVVVQQGSSSAGRAGVAVQGRIEAAQPGADLDEFDF